MNVPYILIYITIYRTDTAKACFANISTFLT